jgi:hypothetical protein
LRERTTLMLQIRGIVKTAQKAQDSLKIGISPCEVAAFKQFITSSVEVIEKLCSQSQIKPSQLPTRSRQAYYFLKTIDLDNLPLVETPIPPTPNQTIRLKNIKVQANIITEKIAYLSANPIPNPDLFQNLTQTIQLAVTQIENTCAANHATPANLTNSSRSIYSWLKFLTDKNNLQLHLETTYRTMEIAEKIWQTHFDDPVNIVVGFTNIAGLYRSRRQGNTVNFVICEGFINASDEILEALLKNALLGKSLETTKIIRDFGSSEEFSEILLELDLIAEAIAENPIGKYYNLDQLFERVQREYFASAVPRPRLAWSQINTYRKFGHYEPAKDRVVISSTLDDARIPEYVTEFVLYHEVLHKYHGATWKNGKRMVHTPEFRRDERKFKWYDEASQWLQQLASTP